MVLPLSSRDLCPRTKTGSTTFLIRRRYRVRLPHEDRNTGIKDARQDWLGIDTERSNIARQLISFRSEKRSACLRANRSSHCHRVGCSHNARFQVNIGSNVLEVTDGHADPGDQEPQRPIIAYQVMSSKRERYPLSIAQRSKVCISSTDNPGIYSC